MYVAVCKRAHMFMLPSVFMHDPANSHLSDRACTCFPVCAYIVTCVYLFTVCVWAGCICVVPPRMHKTDKLQGKMASYKGGRSVSGHPGQVSVPAVGHSVIDEVTKHSQHPGDCPHKSPVASHVG